MGDVSTSGLGCEVYKLPMGFSYRSLAGEILP